MIHLLNGNKHERTRNSEDCTVLTCKCAHSPTRWLQMCAEHYDIYMDRHLRAMETKREQRDHVSAAPDQGVAGTQAE